jgi:RNA polymerase sigma factor (sigma-70 family)
MKIFDPDKVGSLVTEYQTTGSEEILLKIIDESNSLIKYIVNSCNPVDPQDMIQEATIKLCKSLKSFDVKKANTHTYFARVIKNSCITYFHRDERGAGDCDYDEETLGESYKIEDSDNEILMDIVARNRKRFPSLPIKTIDEITEMIYLSMIEGLDKGRTVVRNISNIYKITRDETIVIYSSSLIYLRLKHYDQRNVDVKIEEFSLSQEMQEILGEEMFHKMLNVFSGVTIHM